MINKIVAFFDSHAEKLVWFVVVPLCIWLLITHVILSPNSFEYKGQKYGVGSLDSEIKKDALVVDGYLGGDADVVAEDVKPVTKKFFDKVECSISNVSDSYSLIGLKNVDGKVTAKNIYGLPQIGAVTDVEVSHIRAVAYVPTEDVDEVTNYYKAEHEPNDIDLVTVEGKFDIGALYESFHESFAGFDVAEEWRDPCLARPVFCEVQLERQEEISEGIWGDWEVVGPTKITSYADLFNVPEDYDKLPYGGMNINLLRFDTPNVRRSLLQPDPYQIASAEEEWFPPSLRPEFIKQRDERAKEELREAKENSRNEKVGRRENLRTSAAGTGFGPQVGVGSTGRVRNTGLGGRNQPGVRDRRNQGMTSRPRDGRTGPLDISRTKAAKDEEDDIYTKLEEIELDESADLSKLVKEDKPLVFWAHDDSVTPGGVYRYRVRLGVFNKTAGTNQLREEFFWAKNKVVLWSDYSKVTETVRIPEKLYIFAINATDTAKTVRLKISRYLRGYWYSEFFSVQPGDLIGKETEFKPDDEEAKPITMATSKLVGAAYPATVDYSTGAVFLDLVERNEFDSSGGKNARPDQYYEMIYSHDGQNLERMSVGSRYYSDALASEFRKISSLKDMPHKEYRAWSDQKSLRKSNRRRLNLGGKDGGKGGRDDAFRDMMMQMRRP